VTKKRRRRPPQPHSDSHTAASLITRLLMSPDFTREEAQVLAVSPHRRQVAVFS